MANFYTLSWKVAAKSVATLASCVVLAIEPSFAERAPANRNPDAVEEQGKATNATLPATSPAQEPTPAQGPSDLVPTEVLVIEQVAGKKRGGSSSSIGTDALDIRTQTSWFYGNRPIVTCYNHIDSFGLSAKEASQVLERSLKRWQQYFKEKRIVKSKSETSPSTEFKFTGKCKGNEDFVVFFGTGPIFGNVQDLKAVQKLNFPVAYVNKTHMSRDMKWGKGYIRLLAHGYYGKEKDTFPDWKKPGALESVLTHEIGHVVGFTHVPGTIMAAELVDQVFSSETQALSKIEIDGSRQLVSCADCPAVYKFKSGVSEKVPASKGLAALGLTQPKSLRLLRDIDGFRLTDGKSDLLIKESSRTEPVAAKTLLTNFDGTNNDSSRAFNLYGSVTVGSRKLPLVLEYNSGESDSAVVLRLAEEGDFIEVGRFYAE